MDFWGSIWGLVATVGLTVAGIVGTVLLVVLVAMPINAASCDATSRQMGLPHRYSFWTGCMVQTPRGWFPLENVRDVNQ